MSYKIRVTASVLFVVVMIFLYWFAEQPLAVGLVSSPLDKLVHAAFGGSVAFILWVVLNGDFAWLNVGIVALLSGLEEWHQSFLPGRVPDFYDFLAATVAALLCVILLRFQKRNIRNL